MAEDPLSTRFEGLLKRYKEKLELLDLDLPAPGQAPKEPAPPAQPEPEPILPLKEPEPALPDWDAPSMQESSPPPRPEPAPQLPDWESPHMEETSPPQRQVQAPPQKAVPAQKAAQQKILPGRKLWPAALALAALAAALAWGYLRFAQEPDYRAFSLSRTEVRGMAWREGRVVVADASNRFLLLFDSAGRRLDSKESLSAEELSDLCWADGTFWSTKPGRSAVFQHDDTQEHGVRRVYATPNRLPGPLAGDNENLWAADAKAAVLYRYLIGRSLNGVSLTPLNQYNLPGGAAEGLHVSEGLLWALDAETRRLTRYAYDAGTLSARDSVDLSARLPAGAAIHGMAAGISSGS